MKLAPHTEMNRAQRTASTSNPQELQQLTQWRCTAFKLISQQLAMMISIFQKLELKKNFLKETFLNISDVSKLTITYNFIKELTSKTFHLEKQYKTGKALLHLSNALGMRALCASFLNVELPNWNAAHTAPRLTSGSLRNWSDLKMSGSG